jgi:VIT1/CCC1 family predicted Fe2+/Mn2+ transporter
MNKIATPISDAPARAAGSDTGLSPADRVFGIMFGLIMALTFTGTLSVASAERSDVHEMLIGALGCNIAWGMVDAVMYLLGILTERGRNDAALKEVRSTPDPARARQLIAEALPPLVAGTMSQGELETIRSRLMELPERPLTLGFTLGDFRIAVGVFLMVFLATLPVALPFLFIDQAHRALRVSNGIALVMLFVCGYYLGRHGGRKPLLSGLITLAVGVVLVWATIALGG